MKQSQTTLASTALELDDPTRGAALPSGSQIGLSDRDLLQALDKFRFDIYYIHETQIGINILAQVGEDPRYFFSDSVLNELADCDTPLRVAYLAYISSYLSISPSLVESRYFARFPEDVPLVAALYCENGSYSAEEISLLNLSLPHLLKSGMDVEGVSKERLDLQVEVSARREVAAEKLMAQFPQDLCYLGEAGENLQLVLLSVMQREASAREVLDVEQMFDGAFLELADEAQSELLRKGLSNLQYGIVSNDCYATALRDADVHESNRRERLVGSPLWVYAHSTIYNFEHSNQKFEPVSRFLIEPAFEPDSPNTLVDRYPLQRVTLRVLEEFAQVNASDADRKLNCDALIEFWDKNRNPIFCSTMAEALSALDPQYAASLLLEKIRNETGYRNHLASLLYRIEVGRLNISEEGVRYLERTYDLRESNEPGFFVQRLTSHGEIGVFDRGERLVKYFSLGDLSSTETHIEPEVLDFTVGTLFYAGKNDSPVTSAKRERWLEEFCQNYLKTFNEEFLQRTGVRFNNLSFKEQGGYVHFVSTASTEQVEQAQQLVKKFGEAGLKSFISLQFDEKLSQGIFSVAEKLPFDLADEIFRKYSTIVDAVAEAEAFSREYFLSQPDVSEEMLRSISIDLLRTAKTLLKEVSKTLGEKTGQNAEELHADVGKLLDGIHQQVALFTSCFKEIAKYAPISYQDVKDCNFNSIPAPDLTEHLAEQILRIGAQRTNEVYSDPGYASLVINELREGVESQDNVFHLIRFGPHLLSFCRAHPEAGTGSVYLGSLSSHRLASSTKVGIMLAEDVVSSLSKDHSLVGYVGPGRDKLLKFYIEHLGFRRAETLEDGTIVIRQEKSA